MNMGKIGGPNQRADAEMQDESKAKKATPLQLGGGGKIPGLKLGGVSRDPDPLPSNESGGKPKLGFGLDLSKA